MGNICIFGDSIAKGHEDNVTGGWAQMLEIYCMNNFDDLEFYNMSISGDSSREILDRFEREVVIRDPEFVVFAYGINDSRIDANGNPNVSLEDFNSNTIRLINLCKKMNIDIVFIGPTNVDESLTNPVDWEDLYYKNSNIEAYSETLKEICRVRSIEFIELLGLLKTEDLYDGIHPNNAGHKKMFGKIRSELKFLENKL